MSCIHGLLNALLRGLVIYAVLGSDWTHSSLHGRAADAANVATAGKPGLEPATPPHSPASFPPPPTHVPEVFLGESRGMPSAWGSGAEWLISLSVVFCTLQRTARDGCPLRGWAGGGGVSRLLSA